MNISIWSTLYLIWTMSPVDTQLGANYIEQYASIAQSEMYRTGIPASIKLAQGMLESDYGRSELAVVAQNHFGIKCGSQWEGKTYYREDDDYSVSGELMKSCFRVFDKVASSYIAHSNFLTDPTKKYRYGFLFDLPKDDFRSWAGGLKAAGYATDPKYPEKLITIIEKYQLYKYDQDIIDETFVESTPKARSEPSSSIETKETPANESAKKRLKVSQGAINDTRYTTALYHETVIQFASRLGHNVSDLIVWNDHLDFPTEVVPADIPVYLEQKARDYHGATTHHEVKENEDLETISQLYGVRVETLRSLNRLSKNAVPLPGEKIYLKDKVKSSQRPKYQRKALKQFIPGM